MTTDTDLARRYVLWANAFALVLIGIVAIVGGSWSVERAAIITAFTAPFAIPAVTIVRGVRTEVARWMWLTCALAALVPSCFLIFSGIGFFLLAIACTSAWAFWITRATRHLPAPR
jgi:hypothetical protein